jgi:small subunit ribosomal protein S2
MEVRNLAAELVKELIDAGVHFGHRVSRWNPKMKPYIFGKRNLIHIINVKETLKGILLAKKFITRVVGEGKDILVVGTKRQARKAVEENSLRTGMHSVTDRWLGGTLTNFREIRKRVGRLEHLEQLDTNAMMDTYSKKQGASLRREMRKIKRNLEGIRRMERFPGVLVVIDQRREINAVREANKLGIPVIALLDTDGDPDMVDIPIPGNDDAMRAIELVVKELCDAAAEGKHARVDRADDTERQAAQRPRSRRPATARAVGAAEPAESAETPAPVAQPSPGAPAEPPANPPA